MLLGLIGAGIQASRTPAMHEREAGAHGIACTYRLLDLDALAVSADALPTLIGDAGLNVPARADALAQRLGARFPGRVTAGAPSRDAFAAADGLIHATPIGMASHPGMAVPVEWLHSRL